MGFGTTVVVGLGSLYDDPNPGLSNNLHMNGHSILDASNVSSILPDGRTLFDSGGNAVATWDSSGMSQGTQYLRGQFYQQLNVSAIYDSSGGTSGGNYIDPVNANSLGELATWTANAVATLTAKINELLQNMQNASHMAGGS